MRGFTSKLNKNLFYVSAASSSFLPSSTTTKKTNWQVKNNFPGTYICLRALCTTNHKTNNQHLCPAKNSKLGFSNIIKFKGKQYESQVDLLSIKQILISLTILQSCKLNDHRQVPQPEGVCRPEDLNSSASVSIRAIQHKH